jgi:hypothetical protein
MSRTMHFIATLATAAMLLACSDPPPEPRADWVLHARLVFPERALSADEYRLWFPYVVGDFYGAPDTVDFIQPVPQSDGTIVVDLNEGHDQLLAALKPEAVEFSLSFMKIEPAEARIARLTPMAMQADGIEQVGRTDWIDADSKQRLMLLYADRPCRIYGGPYDIRIPAAGFVWIGETMRDGKGSYAVTPQPASLELAITPAP